MDVDSRDQPNQEPAVEHPESAGAEAEEVSGHSAEGEFKDETKGESRGEGSSATRGGVEVRLEKFQGPLDLLMHLIQRDEIDIRDIPISNITQQFLHYIDMMRLLDLDVTGEFLVMAATLMRIKARMLLPIDEPIEGEEDDPREELVRRLIEYRQYKEVAGTLREKEEIRRDLYERGTTPDDSEGGQLPLTSITLFDLLDALDRVLNRLPEKSVLEMEGEVFDIDDKMAYLAGLVRDTGRLSFVSVLKDCRSRLEVIVSFLALLELLKMGRVVAVQETPFEEIWLEVPPGDPIKYGLIADEDIAKPREEGETSG